MGAKAVKAFTEKELQTLEASRQALSKTLVGQKLVAMEQRRYGNAKLTLQDGTTVMLRSDGSCCATASVKEVSELLTTDHAITAVESTATGERWTIYAADHTLGSLVVAADQGTGYYGFGLTLEVVAVDSSTTVVYDATAEPDSGDSYF